MPRAGWLAGGAIGAALVASGGLGGAPLLAVSGGALIVLAAVLSRPMTQGTLLRAAVPLTYLAAGALLVGLRVAVGGGLGPPPNTAVPTGSGPWAATVVSVSSPRDGRQPALVRLEVGGEPLVSASLPRYPLIDPGDRVRVGGQLRAPGDDGYGQYLVRIGAVATLQARTMEALEPSADPAWIVERLRRTTGEALVRALPEPQAGLAAGILVGLRDRVDRDLANAFTTAGVSHVVAISGWNIAIVGGLVAALLRGLSRRRRAVLTIAVIGAYVAFAGASPSVLRAALMAGVVLVARETGRAGRAAAVLGLAATVLLAIDPRLVLDVGFQLSAIATAGLIAWATPLANRLAGPEPGRLRRWLADSLGVSLAAQAATLPIVLATFGRLSLVAPAVNLLVVPLIPPAMAAGAVGLVAGWATLAGAPAAVAVLLGLPAWAILGAIVAVVRAGAGLPLASVGLDPPWSALAGGAAGIAILALSSRAAIASRVPRAWIVGGATIAARAGSRLQSAVRSSGSPPDAARPLRAGRREVRPGRGPAGQRAQLTPWIRVAGLAVAVGFGGLILAVAHRPDGGTRIVVLDVGQGDAILVEGARGARLLVDSGPNPEALLLALDERLPPWDRRLDVVVLTHPHEDHVAGAALLLDRYRIGRILQPGMRGPGPGDAAARAAIAARSVEHGTLARGDRLVVDDLSFTVLWPDPGRVPLEPPDGGTGINNVSIVLLGEVGGRRVLLTGDMEEGVDPILLERGLPAVDFLKVAHHGSATASSGALLDALRPAVAVISSGKDNPYGHPAPATLSRLAARGAQTLRTDRAGDVETTFLAGRMTVRTEREVRAEPVSAAAAAASSAAATSAAAQDAPGAAAEPVRFGCAVPLLGPPTPVITATR